MKQMSTGFGLAVLGFGIATLGLSNLAGSRGNQAQAQSGSGRSIVSASLIVNNGLLVAYRIWSDNTIDVRPLVSVNLEPMNCQEPGSSTYTRYGFVIHKADPIGLDTTCNLSNGGIKSDGSWLTVDNGLTSFVPADVDASGTVDPADLGGVLIEMGNTQEGNPPPQIDCTINAPR